MIAGVWVLDVAGSLSLSKVHCEVCLSVKKKKKKVVKREREVDENF